MEIILSHYNPDFDGYACMVAASHLYPEAKRVVLGKPASSLREFLHLHQGRFPTCRASDIDPKAVTRLILVDTSQPQRLGPFRLLAQQSGVEVHVYDHHQATAESVQGEVTCILDRGAAITVVLEQLPPGTPLSSEEATLYLIAIYEETGHLSYPSTTPQDLKMAAWLLEQGAQLWLLNQFLQQILTPAQRDLRQLLLEGVVERDLGGVSAWLVTARQEKYCDGLAEVVSELLKSQSIDLVLAAVQMGRRLYLVGRSRHPHLDLRPAFRALGGGGHASAASASLAESDPQSALEKLLSSLNFAPNPQATVGQLMSEKVDALEIELPQGALTVSQADLKLRELGRTATVLTRQGEVTGMLSRRDLDKALSHGLRELPVTAIMTQPVISIAPQAELSQARSLMVHHDLGRLPVMDQGRLVGIISRTDLLRHLYQAPAPDPSQATSSQALLQLPLAWLELLKQAGAVAYRCGVEAYAVGGFVRDLLLNQLQEHEWDLDLCIEGSIEEFLTQLSHLWQASLHQHARFETATLRLANGQKIDVARARQEHYVRPAALPEVEGSNLKQDLFRRDFTINALALRLTEGHFGELVDFFGGRADLQGKQIRVLHNYSFIDDPTRILRAIRLEQRLNFHLGQTSEHLLRSAVQAEMLPLAGPSRLREEVIRCLSEPKALAILERLNKLKVLSSLHPELALDPKVQKLLGLVGEALVQLDLLEVQPWLVYAKAWFSRLSQSSLKQLLHLYRFRAGPQPSLPQILWKLNNKDFEPSQVYSLLKPLENEDLVLLWAMNLAGKTPLLRVQERILRYVEVDRHRQPFLKGQDILAQGIAPGPEVARWKQAAFDRQIDQDWTHPEQAQAWLRQSQNP